MTTPALDVLRSLYPNAWIAVLGRPWVRPVLSHHPAVDEVLTCEFKGPVGPVGGRLSLARCLRQGRFDMSILFPNSFDSALLFWLAGIPYRLGYATDWRRLMLTAPVKVPHDRRTRHEVYYYLGLVNALRRTGHVHGPQGALPEAGSAEATGRLRLSLRVPPEGEAGADALLRGLGLAPGALLVGLNPGAAFGPAKRWPAARFAALGRALVQRYGCHVLVFGTDAEADEVRAICSGIGRNGQDLAGRTSLAEAMALIRRLSLLVTNDSGLMHVAAAMDVPLVAIFGSTNPVTTGPWSPKSRVVRHEMGCSPCLRRDCPSDFRCMRSIGVEEVLGACDRQVGAAA